MISRDMMDNLKCRISDTDGFKTIKYIEGDLSSIKDGDYIILVCDDNHINKYAIVADNTNNPSELKIDGGWHDSELKLMYQNFNSIRTSIPDIDRERFLDFFSFCNLWDGQVYAAALSMRVILEDFLVDVYSKPSLSYMKTHYNNYYQSFLRQFKNSKSNMKIERFLYDKMNTTKMIEKIETIDPDTHVKKNSRKFRSGNYISILRNYLNYTNSPELWFNKSGFPLNNLWRLSSDIVHGKPFAMVQLIDNTSKFIESIKKHIDEGLKWKI